MRSAVQCHTPRPLSTQPRCCLSLLLWSSQRVYLSRSRFNVVDRPTRYKGLFREQAIDGSVLLMLSPDDLRSHFQVRTIRETTQILEKVRTGLAVVLRFIVVLTLLSLAGQ